MRRPSYSASILAIRASTSAPTAPSYCAGIEHRIAPRLPLGVGAARRRTHGVAVEKQRRQRLAIAPRDADLQVAEELAAEPRAARAARRAAAAPATVRSGTRRRAWRPSARHASSQHSLARGELVDVRAQASRFARHSAPSAAYWRSNAPVIGSPRRRHGTSPTSARHASRPTSGAERRSTAARAKRASRRRATGCRARSAPADRAARR